MPPLWWIIAATSLLLAAAFGFGAGVMAAPSLHAWRVQRARRSLQKWFRLVLEDLNRARETSQVFLTSAAGCLGPAQWNELEVTRSRLLTTLNQLVNPQSVLAPESGLKEALSLGWLMTPTDTETGLPNGEAFHSSLSILQEGTTSAGCTSALVLVRIDRFAQLKRRVGLAAASQLAERTAALLLRSQRDADYLARLEEDLFGVLLPEVSPMLALNLTEQLRSAVREHRFHVNNGALEVVVTASFGCSILLPGEQVSAVRDRALEALNRSYQTGRNQFHWHNGQICSLVPNQR